MKRFVIVLASVLLITSSAFGATAGDVDGIGDVDLRDVIMSLQVSAGITPLGTVNLAADVNGDVKIGLAEAIYGLQVAAQLRQSAAATTWQQTNGPYGVGISAIATSGSNVVAGASGCIYLSTNFGAKWTQVTNFGASSFAVKGSDIFAASFSKVYLSTDSGVTWTQVSNGLPSCVFSGSCTGITSLAVSGSNIFAGTSYTGSNSGVYLSVNNGASWTLGNNGLPHSDITQLAVSGSNVFAVTRNRAGYTYPKIMARIGFNSLMHRATLSQ